MRGMLHRAKTRLAWWVGGLCIAVLGCVVALSISASAAHPSVGAFRYEVTLTNLTRGQIFSPAVVATHGHRMEPIFRAGEPASEELAAVAEDAVVEPLMAALRASGDVAAVELLRGEAGPILPGESASVRIDASARGLHVSVVGMLVTTNDAFYALNGERGPVLGSRSFYLRAYDAGSEANNELCSYIPGPPCGSAGVRAPEDAEGFVHVHAGIHGVGDLEPAVHDWKNPVARLTIRRVRG